MEKRTRFYQASTSELYGKVQEVPQRETTPFYPRSPYGVAKLYAYWMTVNYLRGLRLSRFERHSLQSRGPNDLRRNLRHPQDYACRSLRSPLGLQDNLFLGNLDAERDWGHARDILRRRHVDDPAAGAAGRLCARRTGEKHDQCANSPKKRSPAPASRSNGAVQESRKKVSMLKTGRAAGRRSIRATSVRRKSNYWIGDPTKAHTKLGWRHVTTFDELVREMVESDIKLIGSEEGKRKSRHDWSSTSRESASMLPAIAAWPVSAIDAWRLASEDCRDRFSRPEPNSI